MWSIKIYAWSVKVSAWAVLKSITWSVCGRQTRSTCSLSPGQTARNQASPHVREQHEMLTVPLMTVEVGISQFDFQVLKSRIFHSFAVEYAQTRAVPPILIFCPVDYYPARVKINKLALPGNWIGGVVLKIFN